MDYNWVITWVWADDTQESETILGSFDDACEWAKFTVVAELKELRITKTPI
jgi:hypothetical protein